MPHLATRLYGLRKNSTPNSPVLTPAVSGVWQEGQGSESHGQAYLCVVSDHGFAPVQHDVNLYAAFLGARLITPTADFKIADWSASPWPAGGGAAIMLKDPKDEATRQKVSGLLNQLAADPVNGIDRILNAAEIQAGGGFPDAAFFVSFKIGYELGYKFAPPLVSAPTNLGMHGYLPTNPEMRSSFFLIGPNVAKREIDAVDMRSIAPTLADLLGAKLPTAELPALKTR